VVRAGEHERVQFVGIEQVLVVVDLVAVVGRGEDECAEAEPLAGLGDRVHEPIQNRTGVVLAERGHAHGDQVGPVGAQLAGGAVRPVAEFGDGRANPLLCLGLHPMRCVEHIGHGLSRHPGALGHRGDGRPVVGHERSRRHPVDVGNLIVQIVAVQS